MTNNLKDEIEGILFENNTHLMYRDGWGNEPESYGSEIGFDQVYLRKAVEALTSLIQQEKKDAVKYFASWLETWDVDVRSEVMLYLRTWPGDEKESTNVQH